MQEENRNSVPSSRVAVLIPTYNRPDLLGHAIESVLRQTYRDWELFVINDGGEDVSKIVNDFKEARIKYLSAPHKGKSAALNLAIRSSQSEFIGYLDDDDIHYPKHLQLLVEALDKRPDAVAAYSDTYLVHLRKSESGWEEAKREVENTQQITLEMLLEVNYVNHKNLLHRRRVLERTGLYDETLEVLIDWDITLRLFAAGPVVHVREITGEHFLCTDASGNMVNAITGVYYQDREKYLAQRCRILAKTVYLPLIAQGKQPPEGGQAEDEIQQLALLVQRRLEKALPVAGSKEEVEGLRRVCKEQWEALARLRATPLYKIYQALKAAAARFRH